MSISIASLVDEGYRLRGEIKERQVRLKMIEGKLAAVGLKAEQEELKDADREGRRWLARGSELIVPVIFTADKLVQSFKHDSPMQRQIVGASGGRLADFYELTQTYEILHDDGKKFRRAAAEILGDAAPKFVTACLARDKHGIPKSDIKIAWEDAEAVEGAGKMTNDECLMTNDPSSPEALRRAGRGEGAK